MKNKKTIGILGGMGPLAGIDLCRKLVKISQDKYGAVQDYHYPSFHLYNLPLFGLDETGLVYKRTVKNQLINGVKILEKAGCDCIVIACNTVHNFHQILQNSVEVPIIHMVDETVNIVKSYDCPTIGLLASESTQKSKLYHKKFKAYGIKTLSPLGYQQKIVNKVVLSVMAGKHGHKEKQHIISIVNELVKRGAQSIVLGCTELPLVINQKDVKSRIFDSTYILAEKAIEYVQTE